MPHDDGPLHLAWLLLHDQEFSSAYVAQVEPEDYPEGALRGLLALAQDQQQRYRRTVTDQTLDLALQNGFRPERYGTSPEAMEETFSMLDAFAPDDESYGRAQDNALEWLELRRYGRGMDQAMAALDSGNPDRVREALASVRQVQQVEQTDFDLEDDIREALQPLSPNVIPTGLSFIDKAWEGGMRRHELGVLFSSTNAGKSMACCFLSISAFKADRLVWYLTFELTPRQILRRIASGLLRRAPANVNEDVEQLLSVMRERRGLGRARIRVRAGNGKSVHDLALDIEEARREGAEPDVVVLDSADDFEPSARGDTQLWARQAQIYTELRHLAVETGVAIWTSTQANRDALERARISLKHMGQSYAKAQRAHYVVGLAQTEQQKEEMMGPLMSVYILKDSEHGSPGKWREVRVTFGRGSGGYPGFIDDQEDPF